MLFEGNLPESSCQANKAESGHTQLARSAHTEGHVKLTLASVSEFLLILQGQANQMTIQTGGALPRAITTRKLKELIIKIWLCLPYLTPALESLATTLGREPMLLISDSINFEDVLERRYTLQYGYYQNWRRLESFLRHQFSEGPGKSYVQLEAG
ncbi:hypothetical protein QBC44DRAFT_153173 [Cladorrhinum sp. PSN332]|nr:hypothetical protein QBC44DRAFT_153173 [Cladorrhinum sp. PSN332]